MLAKVAGPLVFRNRPSSVDTVQNKEPIHRIITVARILVACVWITTSYVPTPLIAL